MEQTKNYSTRRAEHIPVFSVLYLKLFPCCYLEKLVVCVVIMSKHFCYKSTKWLFELFHLYSMQIKVINFNL